MPFRPAAYTGLPASGQPITFNVRTHMSPTLIAIALSLATGLCVLAYQTPKIFKKLFNPLFVLCLLVHVGVGAWGAGYKYALLSVSSLLPAETIKALEQSGLPESSFFIVIGLFVFIFFLNWLAGEVIEHRENEKPKQEMGS